MKKFLGFVIVVLLISPIIVNADIEDNHLLDVKKADSTAITVDKIKSIEKTEGAYGPQGFEVTDKYFIIAQVILDGEGTVDNPILVYDKNTLEYVKTIHYNIGHGDDICYNSDTHELLFVKSHDSQTTLVVFDSDKLTFKKNIEIDPDVLTAGRGLTYNPEEKQYIMTSGTWGYIFNQDFELQSKFDLRIRQIAQSLEFSDENIYYSTYSYISGEVTYQVEFESFYAVIYVFDKTGKYLHTVYIPQIGTDKVEIEGTAIDDNGDTYFVYNNYTTGKIEIYKAAYDRRNKISFDIPISIDNKQVNNTITFNGYYKKENSTDTKKLVSKDSKFSIDIDLYFIGNEKYEIYQTNASDNDVELDKEAIVVTVTNKYVLAKNKTISTYELSRKQFNNSTKDISTITNVPDTFKGRGIIGLIIGIICIVSASIVCFPIYKKRKVN
ncbi:MAG: hypothetical protein IJI58_00760 [Bacilli bacterium]|nr:hypothetical protein [Bacilli bacterium]